MAYALGSKEGSELLMQYTKATERMGREKENHAPEAEPIGAQDMEDEEAEERAEFRRLTGRWDV